MLTISKFDYKGIETKIRLHHPFDKKTMPKLNILNSENNKQNKIYSTTKDIVKSKTALPEKRAGIKNPLDNIQFNTKKITRKNHHNFMLS